ncbi:MAG: 4-hydroxyphenylpyruvate dioxygenase [Bacteriovoracales bacterium]|nr:4-hydroxyphenylpyruvate dioxygenase [Bacteriovoracales bacterium]
MQSSQNPLGLLGIDHLEFTADSLASPTKDLFYELGFSKTFETDGRQLFTQGQIRFLLNAGPIGPHRDYFQKHGEGVSKISFLVQDTRHALETAVKRGGEALGDLETTESEHGVYRTALIKGFGDVVNEFVERPNRAPFRPDMKDLTQGLEGQDHPGRDHPFPRPLPTRVSRIDHLTNNVPKGEMEHWAHFYQKVYGFVETRYFDIKGQKTGLQSKVMQLVDNSIIIPINEPDEARGKSQIQEFLDEHRGSGVQHIALMSPDIISTVGELTERGIPFLDVPDTYYEQLPNRPFTFTEERATLNRLRLLADGDSEGYLLQIFTKPLIGPLFFEFIQRKNNWGFGEGNFQALFEAIERDQMKRGQL